MTVTSEWVLVEKGEAEAPGQAVSSSSSSAAEVQTSIECGGEVVLKVSNGGEILRLRVPRPLDAAAVRSAVRTAVVKPGDGGSCSIKLDLSDDSGGCCELSDESTASDLANISTAIASLLARFPDKPLKMSVQQLLTSPPVGSDAATAAVAPAQPASAEVAKPPCAEKSPLAANIIRLGPLSSGPSAIPQNAPSQDAELAKALADSSDLQRAVQESSAAARARLAHVLNRFQAKLRPVEADGNCQFRALALQLYDDQAHHGALRSRVIAQLCSQRERYEPYVQGSFDDYLKRMSTDGEWGDNVTLQAASDALCVDIHVLTDQPGSELVKLHPAEDNEAREHLRKRPRERPLCLTFLTEVHYDAAEIENSS